MIGIVAGGGRLPIILINHLLKQGEEIALILINGEVDTNEYMGFGVYFIKMDIGAVGKAVEYFKDRKVNKIVFAGSVHKPKLKNIYLDGKGFALATKILVSRLFGDDNMLRIVSKFFEKNGFTIVGVQDIMPDILAEKKIMNKINVGGDLQKLIDENIKVATDFIETVSRFDIGQSVAICDKHIIGIEAMEGTDNLIKRCKDLATVSDSYKMLIKMPKKNQISKIDLPSIGVNTINNLAENGFKCLVIKAEGTVIIDKENVLEVATKSGIVVVGF